MVITFMYQSVLINKLTVVELVAPVDSLDELFLQDLTPFIFHRRCNPDQSTWPFK